MPPSTRPRRIRTKFFLVWWITSTVGLFAIDMIFYAAAWVSQWPWPFPLSSTVTENVGLGAFIALLGTIFNWNKVVEASGKKHLHIV